MNVYSYVNIGAEECMGMQWNECIELCKFIGAVE